MSQWINGVWLAGDGEAMQKHNPVNGELLWEGTAASAEQVIAACEAARNAFPGWAKTSLTERRAIVEHFAHLLEKNKDELTATIAQETGKPRRKPRR